MTFSSTVNQLRLVRKCSNRFYQRKSNDTILDLFSTYLGTVSLSVCLSGSNTWNIKPPVKRRIGYLVSHYITINQLILCIQYMRKYWSSSSGVQRIYWWCQLKSNYKSPIKSCAKYCVGLVKFFCVRWNFFPCFIWMCDNSSIVIG